MTEKELMLSEQLYIANDPELGADNQKARRLTWLINTASTASGGDREQIQGYFRELLKKTGENFWIEPPFRCDYGCHISVGENFYANYDCIILDVCEVNIGDNVFFGPRISVYTAGHPVDAGSEYSAGVWKEDPDRQQRVGRREYCDQPGSYYWRQCSHRFRICGDKRYPFRRSGGRKSL